MEISFGVLMPYRIAFDGHCWVYLWTLYVDTFSPFIGNQ